MRSVPSVGNDRAVQASGAVRVTAASLAASLWIVTASGSIAAPGDPITLAKPQPARIALAAGSGPSGREILGTIERWDDVGISGTFDGTVRTIRWEELAPIDIYRVRKKLLETVDDRVARRDRFLELAALLVSLDDGDRFASRAFEDATRLGADETARAAAKVRALALRAERDQRAAEASKHALRSGPPDADAAMSNLPATDWPALAPEKRAEYIAAMRNDLTGRLVGLGRDIVAVEGTHALVASELGAADGALRATEIDAFVKATLPRLGLPNDANPWWGKLAVIVMDDPDRFTLLEASAFKQKATKDDVAFTHYDGEKVFVVVLRQSDAQATRIETARAVARAILYRHRTAMRLPLWLQEGLVDWLVSMVRPTQALDARLRKPGLAFVRGGGSLESLLQLNYVPGNPPFSDDASRSAVFVLLSYLGEKQPLQLALFLEAAKRESDWKPAFEKAFGTSVGRALAVIREYYRVND